MKVYETIGDLIEGLKKFAPGATPFSTEPPFTGVRLIEQTTGGVLIAPPPREENSAPGSDDRTGASGSTPSA